MLPEILLLIAQITVLCVMAAGFIVVHVGPRWLRERVARFYAQRIAHR